MIEAQIICSHPCTIQDLGLTLKRGEERWISITLAEQSKDLSTEQRKGNVRVYRKVRRNSEAPKRPAPPFVAASRPQVHQRTQPEVIEKHIVEERIVEKSVDVEELAKQMRAELVGELLPDIKQAIAQEVGKALAEQPQKAPEPVEPQTPAMDASQLESVLEGVLRRVGVSGGAGGGSQGGSKADGPEDPLFIPTAIVDKGAKGKITVKSKKSEGTDDLDDAQAALREMKRARRGKKKGNEEK